MKSVLLGTLRFLAWVALILAFVPILFPLVLAMGVLLSLTVLIFFPGAVSRDASGSQGLFGTGPPASGSTVLRRSILAMGISLGLYLLLWLHSQLFYVGPLKKDQEPFRRDAFEQLRESGAPMKAVPSPSGADAQPPRTGR